MGLESACRKGMNKMIKIAFFNTSWPTNIGNAFIDLGSIQLVKAAMPECIIHTFSGYPRILFRSKLRNPLMISKVFESQAIKTVNRMMIKILKRDRILKEPDNRVVNYFDLRSTVKSDYAVFSGMILWEKFIKLYKSTFLTLRKKNVKIIFNGVGGPYYSEDEIVKIRRFLKEIGLYAFVSRDEKAFKCYQDLAEHSHDGIDCGFFINDYYAPPELEIPEYVILNFDRLPIPRLKIVDKLVIYTHHFSSEIYPSPKRYFTTPNAFISDSPDDYLALYSNTSATFSDRVHACVVTLSFGHPSKLFVGSDAEILNRMLLFKKIDAKNIVNRLTYPDTRKIEKEKEKQVRFLSEIFAPD